MCVCGGVVAVSGSCSGGVGSEGVGVVAVSGSCSGDVGSVVPS